MATFCSYCGRPLADGESCGCQANEPAEQVVQQPVEQEFEQPQQETQSPAFSMDSVKGTAQSLWEKFKNQIGIGDPELNQGDAFEKGKQIEKLPYDQLLTALLERIEKL